MDPKCTVASVGVLVFRTDATEDLDQRAVSSLFGHDKRLRKWNFDFEDCDNIFRVESLGITGEEVIRKLDSIGIRATELAD